MNVDHEYCRFRSGAGSMPCSLRIRSTVVRPISYPDPKAVHEFVGMKFDVFNLIYLFDYLIAKFCIVAQDIGGGLGVYKVWGCRETQRRIVLK